MRIVWSLIVLSTTDPTRVTRFHREVTDSISVRPSVAASADGGPPKSGPLRQAGSAGMLSHASRLLG
jgi:hypothetical protein